jgi:hypothetical protein
VASPADLFQIMAARIERVRPEEFSGAVLIVPPLDENGELTGVIEVLTIEGMPSAEHFWGSLKIRVDTAVSQYMQELQQKQSGLRMR